MSSLLLGKVLATNIPTGPKFVLTILADHANDFGGSCFPSVPLIADKCSQTEVSVRKHIQWLEAHGLILRNHGRGEATFYQLVVSRIDELWVDLRAKHLQAYVKAERARGKIATPPLEKLSTGTTKDEGKPRVFTEKESYGVNFLPRKNLTGLISYGVTANPHEIKEAPSNSPPKNLTELNSYPVNNLGYNRLICLKPSSTENGKLSTGSELAAGTAVEAFCAHLVHLENERGKRITINKWELAKVASWIQSGFTLEELTEAHRKAVSQRTKKSDPAPIGVGYLDPILRTLAQSLPNTFTGTSSEISGGNPASKQSISDARALWYLTDKGIEEEAQRLGLSAYPGETFPQFKHRILAHKRVSREQYLQDLQSLRTTHY